MTPVQKLTSASLLLVALAFTGIGSAAASVIFSDNFDDGDVSDWGLVTNHGGPAVVTVLTGIFVSAPNALYTYFDTPPDGTDSFVRATHGFVAPITGIYTVDFFGRSDLCSGCVVSYDFGIDNPTGAPLLRLSSPNFAPNTVPVPLTAGAHTLWFGVDTTNGNFGNGRFSASFDDVVITSPAVAIPEPSTYALVLAGFGVVAFVASRRRKVSPPTRPIS